MSTDPILFLAQLLGIDPTNPAGIKPGAVASKFEALAARGLDLSGGLPDGPLKQGIRDVLQDLVKGTNAFARVAGGSTLGELSEGPARYASGSGLEAVEAQLRSEAANDSLHAAPSPGNTTRPPPARDKG